MTIVEVTIDEDDISVKGRGVGPCSDRERKFAAVLIAATNGVARSMETGEHERQIAELIASTIKQRLTEAGPCSPCGDGDTAMKYHNHDNNLRQFPARVGAKVGIVGPIDQMRDLMREFIQDAVAENEDIPAYEWRFERFLQWAARREKEKTNET